MAEAFPYDVFLSHSSKDKPLVRSLAERLKNDGLKVWFDEWEMKPGDNILAKIEDGLEHSRVLALFMSTNALGADWPQLEAGTFRFRDPMNKERRFIPVRIDNAPIKATLAQFLHIDLRPEGPEREQEYTKLLEACRAELRASQPDNRTDWRSSLALIQRQFEVQAERSGGLHSLLVEVSNEERSRLSGPAGLVRLPEPGFRSTMEKHPWLFVNSGGLPTVWPAFREVGAEENISKVSEKAIIRDGSGVARAIAVPMRLREGYLCGDDSQLRPFKTLAKAASQVITDEADMRNNRFSNEICDLFRRPRGGVRYVFGVVPSPPDLFIAQGWQAGVLVYKNGVLIDEPIAESFPDEGHWILLLHRLSWRREKGCPLVGARIAWNKNTTVPYEWMTGEGKALLSPDILGMISRIPATSFYSVLGDKDCPLDVNLASAFAIRLILSAQGDIE